MTDPAHHETRRGRFWTAAVLVGLGFVLRGRLAEQSARSQGSWDSDAAQPPARPALPLEGGDRGRGAGGPQDIPKRGWKDIILRTIKEFGEDQITLISAGVTFYALLALFPALAAMVSIYGLFSDPAQVPAHLERLAVIVPAATLGFVSEQLTRISAAQGGGLSIGALVGLLLSLWSANGAMKALFTGLNIAYDEGEHRGFVAKTAITLAFTIAFLLFGILALGAVAAVPALGRLMGDSVATVVGLLTWPFLVVAFALVLGLLYRYGPNRDPPKWRWVTWGSAAAIVLWLAFSGLFSLYLGSFANYNETYGSLGAVIGFMMWIYVSSQVILFGAELNSEMEHQTLRDTTVGPEQPFGRRGAVMADTVGEAQGR